MFGFIKKLFGGKPAEAPVAAPYKVEVEKAAPEVKVAVPSTPKVAATKKPTQPKKKPASAKKGPTKPKSKPKA